MKNIFLRSTVLLVSFLLIAASLSAGGKSEDPKSASAVIKMKFASAVPAATPAATAMKEVPAKVQARTNGRIQIEVFTDSQLGNERDVAEAVRMGAIEMSHNSVGSLSNFYPALSILSAPYIWRDENHLMNVVRGKIGDSIFEDFKNKTGIRVLDAGWIWGVRHLTTKGLAVTRPEQLQGAKVRAPEIPIFVDMVKSWGALPVAVQSGDIFMALQTGMATGQENPITAIYSWRLHEVQDHLILTGHMIQTNPVSINDKLFNSLSAEDQKILLEEVRAAGDRNNQIIADSDRDYMKKMEAGGVKVITPDKAAFMKATQVVHKDYLASWGQSLYDSIVNAK